MGYLAVWLLGLLGFELRTWDWLAFIVGGVVGLLVSASLFNVALIGLSSLIGATLITQTVSLPPWLAPLILLILFVVGLLVQSKGTKNN